jgi:hypothetical protein
LQARCIATSEEEQRVSTARHGPFRFSRCEIRPGRKPRAPPVEVEVVIRRNTEIDAGGAAGETAGGNSGVLERFPGHFEGETVLRIEPRRFARRHAKEVSVELIDSI